jgi:E3 ubiquitin-protein ligase RNF14
MMDCGHIFCKQCLQDFYNTAITEGDLASVRCLTPNCAKNRAKEPPGQGRKRRKPKTSVNPTELLQIGLDQSMVKRYVTLKYKTELKSDKNTIYCPRLWCNGAARSKKHKRPEGLELGDSSDDGSDEEEATQNSSHGKTYNTADLLAICDECGFAFCSRCGQSWHGEFVRCMDKRDKDELSAEEKASLEYLRLHTTPCPTCAAVAQKTHGCNHMICFSCSSHFCYLCSAWLDPSNPYRHFNKQPDGKVTSCYMRLWELEAGDGDDVGYAFEGGRRQQQPAEAELQALPLANVIPEIEEPDDDDDTDSEEEDNDLAGGEDQNNRHVAVAREGPLVLRIGGDVPPQRAGRRPVPPPAPVAPIVQGVRGGRGGAHGANRGVQRGRGNRGFAPRGGGRQNLQQGHQGQPNARLVVNNGNGNNDGDLNPQQQDWVRRFIQLALNDEEDMDEWDSDEEEDLEFRIG